MEQPFKCHKVRRGLLEAAEGLQAILVTIKSEMEEGLSCPLRIFILSKSSEEIMIKK